MEGTLAESDNVYRKTMRNGWKRLDDFTEALCVPNGMVIRSYGKHMVFVPCDNYERRDWINANT